MKFQVNAILKKGQAKDGRSEKGRPQGNGAAGPNQKVRERDPYYEWVRAVGEERDGAFRYRTKSWRKF